ncbi:MAG: toprim domain-containing protein [Bacillota bacterium]
MDFKDTINEIKNRLDIADVISDYTEDSIKQVGTNTLGVKCPNPHHSEGRGHDSFRIDVASQKFRCFNSSCRDFEGDEFRGDIFDFVRHMEGGISLIEAMKILIEKYSLPLSLDDKNFKISEEKKKENKLWYFVNGVYHKALFENIGKRGFDYITKTRGISVEMLKKFQLGYAPGGTILKDFLIKKGFNKNYLIKKGLVSKKYKKDKFFKRVTFPNPLYGRAINPNSDYPHLYVKGAHGGLYNFKNARKKKRIILVESHIDLISVYQMLKNMGLTDKVGVLGSYGTNGFKKDYIEKVKHSMIEEIYVFYDGDDAGRRSTIKVSDMLEDEFKVKCLLTPKELDPNDILQSNNAEKKLAKLLNNAVKPIEYEIKYILSKRNTNTLTQKLEVIKEVGPLIEQMEYKKLSGPLIIKELAGRLNISPKQIVKAIRESQNIQKKAN